jgi:uncharacterized protein
MTPTQFTPLASTIGGALIGVASVMLMLFSGRIAGISGILGRLFPPFAGADPRGAAAFVIGFSQTVSDNASLMTVAGLLVGFGAAYGGGCTSGHGVCGMSRLSFRSVVATAIFMGTGFVTVFVIRHVIGG